MPTILYGDPHGQWQPLFDAVERHRPEHVILLGDLGLTRPLRVTLAPVIGLGSKLWWIHGNHDTPTVEAWSYLFEDHPEGNLSNRVVTLSCREGDIRVSGLGGHFKGRVWFPRVGNEPPRWHSPEDFLRQHGRGGRWQGGLPLVHRDTIFAAQVEALSQVRADLLVCHEAPTSISGDMGFGAIDSLARAIGAKLVVHGHHHRDYAGQTRDGIPVRGLAIAQPLLLAANTLGEPAGQ